jgi:hypothetical protein
MLQRLIAWLIAWRERRREAQRLKGVAVSKLWLHERRQVERSPDR